MDFRELLFDFKLEIKQTFSCGAPVFFRENTAYLPEKRCFGPGLWAQFIIPGLSRDFQQQVGVMSFES